jgi:protein tyrosine/serine phosphatase
MPPEAVFAELQADGPEGYARVSPTLYRGGEPSARDLGLLRALGVTKIVDLRRESLGGRRAERAEARRLGIDYVEYPFYGVFGVDLRFLHRILLELEAPSGGAVYVHCDNGRNRTSLVVALHRVVADGWSPEIAWEREALAFGHRPSIVNREIALTFRDYVHEHTLHQQTELGAARRRQAASGVGGALQAATPDPKQTASTPRS